MPWFPLPDFPENRPGAAFAARKAGFAVRRRQGRWMVHAEDGEEAAAAQAWLAAYNPRPLLRLAALQEVKREANRRVAQVVDPEDRERLISRGVALLGIPDVHGRPRTPEEQAELDEIEALWGKTFAVREAAKAIGARVLATTNLAELAGFDAPSQPEWPVFP